MFSDSLSLLIPCTENMPGLIQGTETKPWNAIIMSIGFSAIDVCLNYCYKKYYLRTYWFKKIVYFFLRFYILELSGGSSYVILVGRDHPITYIYLVATLRSVIKLCWHVWLLTFSPLGLSSYLSSPHSVAQHSYLYSKRVGFSRETGNLPG